jgi:hypothetical protein
VALYYQQFPEVVQLLHDIEEKPWILQRGKTHEVILQGDEISFRRLIVGFNPYQACIMRFNSKCHPTNRKCIATPADSLLHELLHVKYVKPSDRNVVIYPIAHEMFVIQKERELYKAMTAIDGISRPYRNSHRGKLIPVKCVMCIK